MHQPRLRIYCGPAQKSPAVSPNKPVRDTVTISLGEVFPFLADAVLNQRTWLSDFEDDEVTIPTDLYEVVLAYQHYRRPSA